jgi:hypothetical protein
MNRFLVLTALSSVAFAAPAVAQDRDEDTAGATAALRELQDPARADAMADMVEGVTAALLQMPVRPIADAVRRVNPDSRMADIPDDATLGDLADPSGRGDTAERVGEQARTAAYLMGDMSRQMEVMLPIFTAMARDMAAQFEDRLGDARRRARR